LPDLDKGCSDYLAKVIDKYQISQITKGDPFDVPAWKTLLQENDPENFTRPAAVPLLMIQGGADEQIPVMSTQLLATHLCQVGQDLERWIYPGQSHAGVIAPSFPDMVHWIKDRFADGANPDPYAPTGLPNIQDHLSVELTVPGPCRQRWDSRPGAVLSTGRGVVVGGDLRVGRPRRPRPGSRRRGRRLP
jgi:hypothetical protein